MTPEERADRALSWDTHGEVLKRLIVDEIREAQNAAIEKALEVYRHSGTSEEVETRLRALKVGDGK